MLMLFINPKFDRNDPVIKICNALLWLLLACMLFLFGVCMYGVLSSLTWSA